MKVFNLKHNLTAVLLVVGLSGSGAVFALTTAADPVDNLATLTFSVGATTGLILESSESGNTAIGGGNGTNTQFVVDRLIDFTVAEVGSDYNSSSTPFASAGQGDIVLEFLLTNNSNADLGFDLVAVVNGAAATNPFAAPTGTQNVTLSGVSIWLEEGTTLGFQSGEDFNQDYIASLDEDGGANDSQVIYVVFDADNSPGGFDDFALVTLVAQAAEDGYDGATLSSLIDQDDNGNISPGGSANDIADVTTTVQTVFADAAGVIEYNFNSPAYVGADSARNGQHSATDAVLLNGASLTVSKLVETIWDPINANSNEKSIPGAYVRYTLTIENNGGSTANLTTIVDAIQEAAVTFDTGLLDDVACAITAAAGFPTAACDDESGADYSVAGTTGVQLEWDAVIGSGADATQYVASGAAFSDTGGAAEDDQMSVNLDTTILTTATTGNTTNGDLDSGQSVTIRYNVIVD